MAASAPGESSLNFGSSGLTYFNQNAFQNWTRQSASIIGSVFWTLDYRAPLSEMRARLEEL